METTTNTNTNQPMQLKRSAAQVHTAAVTSGWEVESAFTRNNILTLGYVRDDAAQQGEAFAANGNTRRVPVAAFTASFDPEMGSYYGATFRDSEGDYANGWRVDTLGDVLAAVQLPQQEIIRFHERRTNEALAATKSEKRLAFVESYRSSVQDDSDGYGWAVKRMQGVAAAEVAPATLEDAYNDPARYLRAASDTATQMVKKALAVEALKRWGQPQDWNEETGEFSNGTTLQRALEMVIAEAFRNYSNKDILPQLQAAAQELDRGY